MPGMMYIPRQQSPWEQLLPQIIGQMAVMKMQQNWRAKEQEMEFAGKVALADGKELTAEETKTPTEQGYRRFKYRGKTYQVPLSAEEQLLKKGYYKLGTEIYKDMGGGKLERITTKYQPQLFINPETGETQWVEAGKPVPEGFVRYKEEAVTKRRRITPSALQKEFEWLETLSKEKRKRAEAYIRERYRFDPIELTMMRSIWGGELPKDFEEEGKEGVGTISPRLPEESIEDYLRRTGQ